VPTGETLVMLHPVDPVANAKSRRGRRAPSTGDAATPLSRTQLRAACKVRMATLADALASLVAAGRVVKSDGRYRLAP
jgi:hypothetical protein